MSLAEIMDGACKKRLTKTKTDQVTGTCNLPDRVTSTVDTFTYTPRTIHLTAASTITVRPVIWTWQDRLVSGTLALLGTGRHWEIDLRLPLRQRTSHAVVYAERTLDNHER